jgi:hypothetical protein
MIKILASIFLFFSSHLYAYDEEEIICIATYELAKNFFLEMKDKKTSQEMEMRQQELFNKYDEGHFPQDDIDFMVTEIHYAWSNNFDFLPPILENCVENIN